MPRFQGYRVFSMLSSPPPRPPLIFHLQLAEMRKLSTRAFLCLSSSACVHVFIHRPVSRPAHSIPLLVSLLVYLSLCILLSSHHHSVVSSQFQNSLCLSLSLSLFAGTVCREFCPPCVVSFRYYVEFNDII